MTWLSENATLLWNATGGALVVLFLSIVSQERRSWKQLLIGSMFGAAGSSFIGFNFADRWWVWPAAGAAAIVTENLALSVLNLSKKFRDDPVNILTHFARLFIPVFGKAVGTDDKYVDPNPASASNPVDDGKPVG